MFSLTKESVGDVFASEGSAESLVNLGLSAGLEGFQAYQARRSSDPGYAPQRTGVAASATQRDSTLAYNAGKSVLIVGAIVGVAILAVVLILWKK